MGFVIPLHTSVRSYYTYGKAPLLSVLSDQYLVPVLSSPGVYGRLLCLPLDATLLMIPSLHHLLKTLDFPSDEGALTH